MKINAIMKRMTANVGMALLMLLMVTSCKSKIESLTDALPADADLVMVGNIRTIVEAMDGSINGSTIKLPSYITDLLDGKEKFSHLLSYLKNSGINVESCAVVVNDKDLSPVCVFALNDEKKFVRSIESEDFVRESENAGMIIYKKKGEYSCDYICVCETYAYLVTSISRYEDDDFDSESYFSNFISSAAETSFASTGMGKYILEGNVGGLSFMIPSEFRNELKRAGVPSEFVDMYRGYVCCKGDMKDNAAKVSLRLFDENGNAKTMKDFCEFIDENAVVSRDVLSYLHNDESLIFAASLKNFNWEKLDLMNNEHFSPSAKSDMALVKSYLERIGGTIAIGIGVSDGWASLEDVFRGGDMVGNLAMTAIVELKDGKVKATLDDLKELLDRNDVPFENIPGGICVPIPNRDENGTMTKWNIQAEDNILVLSNRKIRKYSSMTLDNTNLEGRNMVAVFDLRKGNSLFKDFRINDELRLTFGLDNKDAEYTLECELGSQGSGGYISRLFKMFNSALEYIDKYDRRTSYDEYGGYYDDYTDVDSVEEVVEWEEIDSVADYDEVAE